MAGNDLDQAAAGGIGLAFLLSEFRDMRKGMESRDESIRSSMDGIKESVNVLSAKVDRSQGDVDAVRHDVESMKDDMHSIREDVDGMQKEREAEKIKQESSWAGPLRVVKWITTLGAVAAALWAMLKFGPAFAAFFAALL